MGRLPKEGAPEGNAARSGQGRRRLGLEYVEHNLTIGHRAGGSATAARPGGGKKGASSPAELWRAAVNEGN